MTLFHFKVARILEQQFHTLSHNLKQKSCNWNILPGFPVMGMALLSLLVNNVVCLKVAFFFTESLTTSLRFCFALVMSLDDDFR